MRSIPRTPTITPTTQIRRARSLCLPVSRHCRAPQDDLDRITITTLTTNLLASCSEGVSGRDMEGQWASYRWNILWLGNWENSQRHSSEATSFSSSTAPSSSQGKFWMSLGKVFHALYLCDLLSLFCDKVEAPFYRRIVHVLSSIRGFMYSPRKELSDSVAERRPYASIYSQLINPYQNPSHPPWRQSPSGQPWTPARPEDPAEAARQSPTTTCEASSPADEGDDHPP